MSFEYACFISYRHGLSPGYQKIYESFRRQLAVQVELYLPGMQVYFDTDRLRGGDFFNRALALALCRSVCMISLFNPYYFDPRHPYTAREYQAMVSLERQRLPLLPNGSWKGLIIPVVLRGTLPEVISNERQYYELDLLAPDDWKKRKFLKELRKIAKDIYVRHEAFRIAGVDPCRPCDGFEFPSEADILEWLTGITAPPLRMPNR